VAAAARRAEALLRPVFLALAVLAGAAGAAIVALIGASVTMRYVVGTPLRVTEELVGLLMTAAFLLALPLVTLRSEHVRIRIAVDALPSRLRPRAALLAGVLGVGFCAWFLALSLPWLGFALDRAIRTEVARLLLWPWMMLLPLSLALTGLAFALRALLEAAGGDGEPGGEGSRAEAPER
jgi:TRAP-type C4-dicarboxylate transport system permease small subunit